MQRVIDDILGEVEARIQNVIAGDPAYLDAIRGGDALFADRPDVQPLEVLGPELPGRSAHDTIPGAGDPTGKEPHG